MCIVYFLLIEKSIKHSELGWNIEPYKWISKFLARFTKIWIDALQKMFLIKRAFFIENCSVSQIFNSLTLNVLMKTQLAQFCMYKDFLSVSNVFLSHEELLKNLDTIKQCYQRLSLKQENRFCSVKTILFCHIPWKRQPLEY